MTENQKTCFVLMPFGQDLKEIYTDVYKPVCEQLGLTCWRVDEIARPGSITRDIIEGILDADIIIADLTRQNPNVFYELGIAHATSNKTIMTSQSLDDVPFDIKNYRIILYKHNLRGCDDLRSDLSKAIQELLAALDRTSNPFQELLSSRGSIRPTGKVPITKYMDLSDFPPRNRQWLRHSSIVYMSDLTNEKLEELAKTPGIGRKYSSMLCSGLMQSGAYPDLEFLHNFVVEHKLDATGTRRYF